MKSFGFHQSSNFGTSPNTGVDQGFSYSSEIFFLNKKGNDNFIEAQPDLLFADDFRESMIVFFKDCASLKMKIDSKEYKFRD